MTTETSNPVDVPAQQTVMGIDRALFHRVDSLKQKVRDQESATKAVKVELAEAEEQLVEQLVLAGVPDLTLDGRKAWLKPQYWAAKLDDSVTPQQIVAALRADDLEWLITPESYNSKSLSSFVREREDAGEPLPPALAEVIQPVLRTTVGFGKGTAATRRAAKRLHTPPAAGPDGGESPA